MPRRVQPFTNDGPFWRNAPRLFDLGRSLALQAHLGTHPIVWTPAVDLRSVDSVATPHLGSEFLPVHV